MGVLSETQKRNDPEQYRNKFGKYPRLQALQNLGEWLKDDGTGNVAWAVNRIKLLEKLAFDMATLPLGPAGYCSDNLAELKERAQRLYANDELDSEGNVLP